MLEEHMDIVVLRDENERLKEQLAQTQAAWRACSGESKTCSMLLWFFGFRQALRNEPTVWICRTC